MMNLADNGGDRVEAVLLHPEAWRVVGPFSDDLAPATEAPEARRQWSGRNAHRNTAREILLTVGGTGYFGMGGAVYASRPGTLFIMDPQVPHDYFYPPSASGLEHVWIWLLGSRVVVGWFGIEGGRLTRRQEHVSVLTQEQVGVRLASFPRPDEPLANAREAVRLRLLVGLVAACLAREYRPATSGRIRSAPMSARVVEAVCRHLEDSAGKGATLDFLAHFSGYSKFHLLRLFRAQVGCGIHQYINRVRWQRVRELEREGMSGSAIAEALGFSGATAYYHWRRQQRAGRAPGTDREAAVRPGSGDRREG
jgi:methylphosphotriester-DNA--protein-cysteine methyltransferase